jgi:alpha-methylacyl-CoA racemase
VSGPLSGVRVVEMSALGPAPYGVMLLADLGADVVRVDRAAGGQVQVGFEATMVGLSRNRRSIAVDLKTEAGREVVLRLVDEADVLVEGWRPGVAERLGLGPTTCWRATRGWSTPGRPAGGRTGRGRPRPGTTSATPRSPAPCTPSAGPTGRHRRR